MDIVANELIDQYVGNTLSATERERMEQHFLKSQERTDKLRFARALTKRKTESRVPQPWPKKLYTYYLPIAASVLLLVGLGVGIKYYFFRAEDVNKGLVALQAAFSKQRPVEARISGLNYAPLAQQRGEENFDYLQRDRAASLLLNAASDNPSAASHHALGKYYLAERQFDKAIDRFNAALRLDPRNAQIYSDLGAALLEKGKIESSETERGQAVEDFARSLENLNKALELDNSLQEALFNRALLHRYMALLPEAEEDWRRYLEKDSNSKWADEARRNLNLLEEQIKKTSQNKEEILQGFLTAYESHDEEAAWELISHYHNRTGNVVAEQLLDAYLDQSAKGQKEESRRSLQQLSYIGELEKQKAVDNYFSDLAQFYKSATPEQQGLLVEARKLMKTGHEGWGRLKVEDNLALFSKAKTLFEQAGNICEVKLAEYWISFCHYRQHREDESLAIVEPLASACESSGYEWLLVRAFYLQSIIQFNLNEHSKAVDFARRSFELAERTNDTVGMLNAISSLIEYHRYLGNYRKALSYIQRSLPLVSSTALDPVQGARHYGFEAVTFAAIGLYAAAVDYQREALRFAQDSGGEAAISYNLAFLGMIYGKLGKFGEGLENARRAFQMAQAHSNEPSDRGLMAYSSLQLGNIYRQAGDLDQAVASYNQAIGFYEALPGFTTHLYQAHKGRLLCYVAQKRDELAKEEITTTLNLVETYRNKIREENNRDTFFDVEQSVYDVAIDFEYSRMNNSQQAFLYLESSRARSLLDLLKADKQILSKVHDPDIIFNSVSQPLTLREIQRRMPNQAQILQYAVLENRLIIWVISQSEVSVTYKEITQKELNEKVSAYLQMMSAASEHDGEEVLRRSKDLYDILIAPVESLLDKNKQLCIVPDKILGYLPFAALASEASGKYVIEDHTLVLSQSPTMFVLSSEAARAKEGARDERLLSVGNPSLDRNAFPAFPDLPSAGVEAVKVSAQYNSASTLTDNKALPEIVKSEMEKADIIHLAAHSAPDETLPLRSKLLLAKAPAETFGTTQPESVLYAYEIYNLNLLRARLVVLSACQSGAERYYSGEGMSSLARPFIAVGVPLVVASLWPVDSDSTAELMISFHQHRRREKLSTAEALRNAQLDMLRNPENRFSQPYYWASFIVVGGYARF